MDADNVLSSARLDRHCRITPQEWEAIARLALQRLSTFLEIPISHERLEDENFEDGFSLTIYGGGAVRDPFRLKWRGILGADVGGELGPEVSAIVFLYSDGKQLMAKSGQDYLAYRYEQSSTGRYHWTAAGWEADEHDEYGFFDEDFRDIAELEETSPQPT